MREVGGRRIDNKAVIGDRERTIEEEEGIGTRDRLTEERRSRSQIVVMEHVYKNGGRCNHQEQEQESRAVQYSNIQQQEKHQEQNIQELQQAAADSVTKGGVRVNKEALSALEEEEEYKHRTPQKDGREERGERREERGERGTRKAKEG
jgi:hypothetical protein